MKRYILVLFLVVALTACSFGQQTILHCGRLIDGVSGKARTEVTVTVKDGKISSVAQGYQPPVGDDQLIDLKNSTVMPGLMDMHVHLEGEMNKKRYMDRFTMNPPDVAYRSVNFARLTLMTGFTTVRDVGGSGVNISMRNAINAGHIEGPRIFTSGKALGVTGGHADPTNGFRQDLMGDPGPGKGVVNGVNDCRKAVRQRYKNGADLIKITATGGVLSVAKDGTGPHFTEEEIAAVVNTAKDMGMHVSAHAHGDEGMQRAVRAGVHSIEHGTLMSEETMNLMIKKGTWYVPTITAGRSVADSATIPGYYPEIVVPKALELGPKIQETFGKAYKKGVKIAFGTDAGVFRHGLNWREFEYMVEAGMPAMKAIQSATMGGARLLGIEDELGSIEKGKIADIVAVDGNPLEDIKAMGKVSFVMKEGVVYQQ